MRKTIEEFYCDDCEKLIAKFLKSSVFENFDLLSSGIFRRPTSYTDLSEDVEYLCRECMLKALDAWREEVSGH